MERRIVNKVVVIGGGSAGWFTALYAKKMLPEKEVVVIESDSIGILGAGEGTTPHVELLMSAVGIYLEDLVKNTECTLKNGIKFINWNGGGVNDYFYNGFYPYNELDFMAYDLEYLDSSAPMMYAASVHRGEHYGSADFATRISDLNKVPFTKTVDENRVINYRNVAKYALHVDASKLAKYLRTVATEDRGIRRVEGIVTDFQQNEFGDVKSLTLDSGIKISCDFVFDCTGFARYFPKKFEANWVSHDHHLPSDSALPFFLPMEEEDPIPTSGSAIAMNYGWMWLTPLQHRYGCGYVFDSSLTSFDKVQEEIETYLGRDIEPIKEIKYKSGYYSNPWQHNVIAIGLASGFIEPLEASSMWVTVVSLREIFSNPEVIFNRGPEASSFFNKKMSRLNEQVADFIYYHHMTTRSDTEFWAKFTEKDAPGGVKEVLDLFDVKMPTRSDFLTSFWELDTWYRIGLSHNNERIIKSIKRSNMYNPSLRALLNNYDQYKSLVSSIAPKCVDHREFISDLKNS
jgi:tryptophan 7-halogenase